MQYVYKTKGLCARGQVNIINNTQETLVFVALMRKQELVMVSRVVS